MLSLGKTRQMPEWYPLHVHKLQNTLVMDVENNLFATTRTIEQAALIVLVMNHSARRDFE